ncbi:MAG: sugar transferase [Candidatus Omnitrophota bacterium]|nr:sugar transferase [Candidatus Omnitrophota bacterium]
MEKGWYKRPFDIILALGGCLCFAPFFILFSFLIWQEDKGFVFYKQARVGKGAKKFQMLKFRSMSIDSKEIPTSGVKKADPRIRITKIGRFLRSCAMDELPQIINILKGEMSFVGPRPLMPCEAATLADQNGFSVRSSVRPGLTGLAQITIDKYISNDEKLKYDLKYIQEQTFWIDTKLIIHSIVVTLRRKWETQWQNNHSTFRPTKK